MKNVIFLVMFTWVTMGPGPARGQNDVTIDTAGSPAADVSDWADEVCFADDVCDEFPNQQDVTGVCIASDFASTDPNPAMNIFLRFDFDDTTASGANSLDGCWLVDVNQNGFVDRGLCFSLQSPMGPPGTPVDLRPPPDGVRFFTCGDTTTDTCAMDVEVMGSSAACAVNNNTTGADRFPTPMCAPPDAAVECSISLADLGWTSGPVVLLVGCSSTAAQPNSATFDCVAEGGNPLTIDPESGGNFPVELQSFSIE